MLLTPSHDDSDFLGATDSSEAALLLSSLGLALSHCNATLPGFVPVREPSRGAYIGACAPGVAHGCGATVRFETDSRGAPPELFQHLDSLLERALTLTLTLTPTAPRQPPTRAPRQLAADDSHPNCYK